MALPSKTFDQIVSSMVASWAASLGYQPTFQQGDAFYALMESVAAQLVYLEAVIRAVNLVARAQTSTGADLDTFYQQFGFFRHDGVETTGPVQFSKLTPATSQVLIPPGIVVQTPGGALQYQTIADPNQPTWSATVNAYVLQPGQSSLLASVQALQPGAAYNVAANQISQIASSLAGIDTVTNTEPFSNGTDAESDADYSARFVQFLNSLAKATKLAIENAINNVPGVLLFNLQENVDLAGHDHPGEFVATIDDGTGHPSAALVDLVQQAIEQVRGFTIEGHAQAVTYITATIVLAIKIDPAYVTSVVEGAVANAIAAAVEKTPIGGVLYVSTIEAAALAVSGVIAVRAGATLINGVDDDLAVQPSQAARTTINDITVGTY